MKPAEVERLYGIFGHRVYQRCYRLLGEEPAAMDTTQEVFLALLNRLLGFPDEARAGGWLLRVATNKSLNELRRRRYWRSSPLSEEGGERVATPFAFVDDRLLMKELLLGLPDRDAAIATSYFMEGETLEESARTADCSVPTVRRVIERFVERARRRLTEAGR